MEGQYLFLIIVSLILPNKQLIKTSYRTWANASFAAEKILC